jgi:hypothetical protein
MFCEDFANSLKNLSECGLYDYEGASRRAAHASLESMSRLELVTRCLVGTAVVIVGVPVIRVKVTFGFTGLQLHHRVCRMWDKGHTSGEGHQG